MNNRTLNISNTFTQTSLWLGNYSQFTNIVNLDASKLSGIKVLTGNSQSNFITASSGGSSLWGGGAGDNTLRGGNGSDMFWFTGSGNDVVQNLADGVTINSGAGNDTIANFGGKNVIIDASQSDRAVIYNFGESVSLKATDNNDTIKNNADEVIIDAADGGQDYIVNGGDKNLRRK